MIYLHTIYTHKRIQLHIVPLKKVFDHLETNPIYGLDDEVVLHRLRHNGPNSFMKPKYETNEIKMIRFFFRSVMMLIWLCVVLCLTVYLLEYYFRVEQNNMYIHIGLILLIVIIATSMVRYWQNFDDKDIWRAFTSLIPTYTTVIRNGIKQLVLSEELVLGDIVLIKFGDRIGADLRIIESKNLIIDWVIFTGGTETITLDPNVGHFNVLQARNVAFACANIVSGLGTAVVIACGSGSLIAHLAELSCFQKKSSFLHKHIKRITYLSCTMCVFFISCVLFAITMMNSTWENYFTFMIGIILAIAPLNLATSMYFGLWLTRSNLRVNNCVAQNMEATEIIGETTVICSDMIGTLTENQMRVMNVYVNDEQVPTEVITKLNLTTSEAFNRICRCASLCNNAEFKSGMIGVPNMEKEIYGDVHDMALLKFARKYTSDIEILRKKYRKIINKPHNAWDKYHLTVHNFRHSHEKHILRYLVLMKGDLQIILNYCSTKMVNDMENELTEEMKTKIIHVGYKLWLQGRRIIACCELILDENSLITINLNDGVFNYNIKHMCFLGFLTNFDQPRPNVDNAIEICRQAAIKVVVVSQAPVNLAKSIAKQIGIIAGQNKTLEDIAPLVDVHTRKVNLRYIYDIVVNGRQLIGPREEERIKDILYTHSNIVFAQLTHDQHYKIVNLCQQLGAIVTTNGRTLFSAPAVRKADVGFANGITSLNVVKICSDMTLLDDSFATIVHAIKKGLLLKENLKKSFSFILCINLPILAGYLCFLFVELPLPFSIYLSLITIFGVGFVPSLLFYFEKAEENLMKSKHRSNNATISPQMLHVCYAHIGFIEAAATSLTYLIVMSTNGFFPKDLSGLEPRWSDQSLSDISDSYGQEWSYSDRIFLSYAVGIGILFTMSILQATNLNLLRVLRANLIAHGFANYRLNITCILLIMIPILLCTFHKSVYKHLVPIWDYIAINIMLFPLLLLIIEVFRRYALRIFPDSWLEMETFY